MCLIIAQTVGAKRLPRKYFNNAWDNNPDGAGLMFCSSEGLEYMKQFDDPKSLYDAYCDVHASYSSTSPVCVHFRWATHGGNTVDNCHPHIVSEGAALLMHNGILSFDPQFQHESDTAFFCRTVLAFRTSVDLSTPLFKTFLADLIGRGNKFVMLLPDASLHIVNEASGFWDGDTWFSNTSHKDVRIWTPAKPLKGMSAKEMDNRGWPDGLAGSDSVWDEVEGEYPPEYPRELTETELMSMTNHDIEMYYAALDCPGVTRGYQFGEEGEKHMGS